MPEPLHRHPPATPEPITPSEARRRPHVVTGHGLRIGRADVRIDTPSHTPGTNRGEEIVLKYPEKGRITKARTARSATAINPKYRDPIDPRMPFLPPA
jgi:hypothetical protein